MTNARVLTDRRKEAVRRPTDVGKVLANGLIVRALRHSGLHHVLHGLPCAVGIVVPDPEDREVFVAAGREMLHRLSGGSFEITFDPFDTKYEIVEFDDGKTKRSGKTDHYVRDLLTSRARLFAFASSAGDFPLVFHVASDGIVVPGPVGRHALKGAMHAVLGLAPPDGLLDAAQAVPLAMLGPIVRPGRSIRQATRMLGLARIEEPAPQTVKKEGRNGPTLDDLHGLGAAAEWGRSAAQDFADYRAGRITWADMDRGILVSGPPGTGKTTFARALANTCLVPIHVHSLARWQAKGYLNDLLKAMRRAFDEAKAEAPCILFIDELDSFGDRARLDGRHEQYTREVINAFLECLDGIEGREGVVVVGATNLPHRIDPAILRPGRLDRHVIIPLPDLEARKGILRHHLRDALPGADLTDAAERLEGASGAVIEQVVRDARRIARRERRDLMTHDLTAALPPRRRLSDVDFRRVCVHEAGHAVVGCLLREEAGKAPVEARVFREALADSSAGVTTLRRASDLLRTRPAYLAEITGLMAGIAAEEVVLGDRSDGGGGSQGTDLQRATALAAAMDVSLGFGADLAYLASRDEAELLARVRADPALRRTVNHVLGDCIERARSLLRANRPALDELADVLARRGRVSLDRILGIVMTDRPSRDIAGVQGITPDRRA